MAVELRDLTETIIVVTGAGSGIGAATARQLLGAGALVVASDLDADRVEPLIREHGDRVVAVGADASLAASSNALLDAAIENYGRVDSVVANAGVGFYGGILDYDEARIEKMVSTNFLGTVWLAREAVRRFRSGDDGGDIVIVGSVAGLGPGGGNEAVYAATKAAQIQFGTSLDREVRGEGIRVAVIAPAAVNTGFAAATGRFGDRPPEEGVFMTPDDIAYAIVTTLRQPRRMRTGIWTMWSLAEANG
jgi:NAD(P)-dependent dehydrogenase (short-subunit alcohol dehydrogenase family)